MRNAIYADASVDERRLLDDIRQAEHAAPVQGYYAAKQIVRDSGYYDVTDQVWEQVIGDREILPGHTIRSYAQLVSAYNLATEAGNYQASIVLESIKGRVDSLVSQSRHVLRARDPALESALLSMGRISSPINPTVQAFWP